MSDIGKFGSIPMSNRSLWEEAFLPPPRGGGRKGFSHAEAGTQNVLG